MKIGFMAWPLLLAASGAMADSIEPTGTEGRMEPVAAASAPAPAHYRMVNHRPKRLPGGDIRHCLDLKSSADIIRCSETGRRK